MNMQEKNYMPTECVALTVKKENRLMVINKVRKTAIRVSAKTLLYALFLTVLNLVV